MKKIFDEKDLNNNFDKTTKKSVVFITNNNYSPFQLANILKIGNIMFTSESDFDVSLLGSGIKLKKHVFCDKSFVNKSNQTHFASFASKFYNPIDCNIDFDCIIVKNGGNGDIYDVSCENIPDESKIFYSNIKENDKKNNLHTYISKFEDRLVGFSADKSIYNGSVSSVSQIRISKQLNNQKKNIFRTYDQAELMNVIKTKGAMDFDKFRFLVHSMNSIKDNVLFKPLLSNLGSALSLINTFSYALDSFTKKEIFLKVKMNDDRIKRVSSGSKVSVETVKKMCDLLQKLREGDLMSMVQNAAKINPQFKQFESLFSDLLKKK